MAAKKNLRPGEKAPASGQYEQVGPRGGKGKEVTAIRGKPLPPTPTKGGSYKLVDRTRNQAGRGKKK